MLHKYGPTGWLTFYKQYNRTGEILPVDTIVIGKLEYVKYAYPILNTSSIEYSYSDVCHSLFLALCAWISE